MIGTTLGTYEIAAMLGKGGMGEVYRAHDTKLGRDVAIKVRPQAFSEDPERLARFQREAQVLASLNFHVAGGPSIGATRYDVTPDGQRFLVREPAVAPLTLVQGWHRLLP